MDQQPQIQWQPELEKLLEQNHPLHKEICRPLEWKYTGPVVRANMPPM